MTAPTFDSTDLTPAQREMIDSRIGRFEVRHNGVAFGSPWVWGDIAAKHVQVLRSLLPGIWEMVDARTGAVIPVDLAEESLLAARDEYESREAAEQGTPVPCQLCTRIIIPTEAATWSKIDGGLVHLPCLVKAETEAAVSVAPAPAPCAYCDSPIGDLDTLDDYTWLAVNDPCCLPCLQGLAADHDLAYHAARS